MRRIAQNPIRTRARAIPPIPALTGGRNEGGAMKACSPRCAISADACRRSAAVDRSVLRKSLGGPKASPWQATQRLGKAAHGFARRRSARRRSICVMSAPHFSHPGLGRAGRLTAQEILRRAGLPANRGGGNVRRGSWLGPKPTPAGAAAIACRATRLGCERRGGGGLRLGILSHPRSWES